jgi:hypothetical protein
MSQPLDESPFAEPPSRAASSQTRVDRAHVRDAEVPTPVEPLSAIEAAEHAMAEAVTAHQVRLQAAQLASHLERQQSAVDHRESELNARAAAVENEIRSARLWLDERHAELAEHKAELDRRERALAAREAEAALEQVPALLGPGSQAQADRAAELDRREAELEQLAARLGDRFEAAELHEHGQHRSQQLEAYRQNLERAELLLAGQQAEVERQRHELAGERAALAQSIEAERRRLADEQARSSAQQQRVAQDLARQSEELAARQAALVRMQADVQRAQQEALETRLATEELWARLCGTMAPAALAQSLAQIRLKLAEQQRQERAELTAERSELQALAGQLARQHEKLVAAREEAQGWVQARREELQKLAALLVERERQLDARRIADEQRMAEWQNERYRLEQELRRLLRQAGGPANVAA